MAAVCRWFAIAIGVVVVMVCGVSVLQVMNILLDAPAAAGIVDMQDEVRCFMLCR